MIHSVEKCEYPKQVINISSNVWKLSMFAWSVPMFVVCICFNLNHDPWTDFICVICILLENKFIACILSKPLKQQDRAQVSFQVVVENTYPLIW